MHIFLSPPTTVPFRAMIITNNKNHRETYPSYEENVLSGCFIKITKIRPVGSVSIL